MPAMSGAENDVPMSLMMEPRPVMTEVGLPKAITSGFTRPSAVGPTALKGAFTPLGLMEPTVRMSRASAGQLIFFHVPMPSLPALLTSTMPLPASIEAVCEMNDCSPSSWA